MRSLLRSRHPARRGVAMLLPALLLRASLFLALVALPATFASAAGAQNEAPALAPAQSGTGPAAPAANQASMSPSGMRSRLGRQQAEALEAHITTLHRTWRITPAQEPLWSRLTGTMRQGAVQLDAAYARREQQNAGANAIGELQAYALVQQMHASNAAGLVAPFGSLYDSFTPAQKRIADETVRHFTDNALKAPR